MKWHFDDFIYGSIDGAVITFAIVAGVMGWSWIKFSSILG